MAERRENSEAPARIAVAGAGLIGRRHIEAIRQRPGAELAAIVDPAPEAADLAREAGVALHTALDACLKNARPDGVILATPNSHHAAGAMACVEAGVPVLVEKPLVSDLKEGAALVETAERAGVPLLCGHHRRHNPLIAAARRQIEAGALGRIVTVQATAWLMKPDGYFDVAWRREPGAGPVHINLIHDIDLMRHLVGEIVCVHAFQSNAVRGHEVEDTASIILRFENGALGTMSVTDTVPAPWSWELTARENPAYPPTDEACYWIGGTEGALELPAAALWSCPDERSWMAPITRTVPVRENAADPLVRQVANFVEVIHGKAEPVVSGCDGLKALAVIDAIQRSARSGRNEEPSV